MNHSKEMLDKLIAEEKSIGTYLFDEDHKIFTSDVEVVLGLKKIGDGLYKSLYYFFDGYEVGLEKDEQIVFEGTEEEAKEKAILSWNEKPEIFMGYSIVYSNVDCEIMD